MIDLEVLSHQELLCATQALVAEERRITLELIAHLREIERRLLFSEMGYGSLHEFCMKRLGLSEGAAHRRISAMRLIRELPEVQEQIQVGMLSLSNAAQLQGFFRQEEKQGVERDSERKREVIAQVQGLSSRQCEKKLLEISPSADPQESVRAVSATETELKLIVKDEILARLKELKALLAHTLPSASYSELVGYLAEQMLLKIKKVGAAPAPGRIEKLRSSTQRYYPRPIVRELRRRAGFRCEYVSGEDGRRCTSQHALEIDHIIPLAVGGTSEFSNLRLLCRAHNLQQASLKLGPNQMAPYVRALRP